MPWNEEKIDFHFLVDSGHWPTSPPTWNIGNWDPQVRDMRLGGTYSETTLRVSISSEADIDDILRRSLDIYVRFKKPRMSYNILQFLGLGWRKRQNIQKESENENSQSGRLKQKLWGRSRVRDLRVVRFLGILLQISSRLPGNNEISA